MPGARCTRSLVCKGWWHTSVATTSTPGSPGIPARNGFNSLFRALPGDRAFLPPSPAKVASRKLDASVEASGPHDFAVRFSAVRYRHLHVHRIPPRVRDDREPPLMWDETVLISEVIWVGGKQKYFCEEGWTDPKSAGRSFPACDERYILPSNARTTLVVNLMEHECRRFPKARDF
jgi:hypothetical protein